jgi:hypothetical protein
VHEWVDDITWRVANAILYWAGQLSKHHGSPRFLTVSELIEDAEVEKCVTRVALNYIVVHERHHWASRGADGEDGEAKATANGFCDALTHQDVGLPVSRRL